jgi:outer membrane biosynthesis protein TonB
MRSGIVRLVVQAASLLFIISVAGAAQTNPPAYFEFQVTKPAVLVDSNPKPHFPESLKSAQIESGVLAQFIVDTLGSVEIDTFKVLKTSHEFLSIEVKKAVAYWHFTPAEIDGHKVKQLVQMPFVFPAPK